MNWVLQLNNSQSINSFNSLVEKFNTKRSPNQPNQNPSQSVIDRGNLSTQITCLLLKVKRPRSHEIDEKGLHEELVSSDRSGKPEKLYENIRVKHAHDGTGQLVEQNSSSVHTVKEQFVPEENRDIASFNADNEFSRAINKENIDFNIPGVPHSAVEKGKTSCSQEIVGKCLQEELGSSDRTGKPVKNEVNRVMHVHDRTGKPVKSSAKHTHTHSGRIWFCRTS